MGLRRYGHHGARGYVPAPLRRWRTGSVLPRLRSAWPYRIGAACLVAAVPLSAAPRVPTVTRAQQRTLGASAVARCPGNLASRLRSTRGARQLITAVARVAGTTYVNVEAWATVHGCWTLQGGPWPGRIGVNGFSWRHREGDGTTPVGSFGIGPVVFGNAPNPGTRYRYHRLICGDWWDEDPLSPAYNTFQHVACGARPSFGGGSEALWTETAAYPSFAVIDYNTEPIVRYAGSAIFLHASTGAPTDGCLSIPRAVLDHVLDWLVPKDAPRVVMGTLSDWRQL